MPVRKKISDEQRRFVPRRTKIAIITAFALCVAVLVWYKIPYTKQYTATLSRDEEGVVSIYGNVIDVEINVRIQRYFFAEPTHVGTVTVAGDVITNDTGTFVPTASLFGAFGSTDSFDMVCSAWRGDYLITRCTASVEFGQITALSLRDENGAYAGRYGPLPKNSQ